MQYVVFVMAANNSIYDHTFRLFARQQPSLKIQTATDEDNMMSDGDTEPPAKRSCGLRHRESGFDRCDFPWVLRDPSGEVGCVGNTVEGQKGCL